MLTFIGGVVGIILGFGTRLRHLVFRWNPDQITWEPIALGFGVSAVIGIVFGYYPAQRAARLNPIEALRYE